MHELALTERMLELALEAAQDHRAQRILAINISLGALCGVIPSCVEYYFRLQSRGTPAQGARLNMQTRPAVIACRGCGRESRSPRPMPACPLCGSEDFRLLSGQEYYVESIEVE